MLFWRRRLTKDFAAKFNYFLLWVCSYFFPNYSGNFYTFLYRKHLTRQFLQNICMVSWKILCVLTNFWTRSILICSYDISFSWKILCGLQNFKKAHREILMCSSIFFLSWKIWGVFLLHPSFLENLMCSRNLFKKSRFWKKRTDILAK